MDLALLAKAELLEKTEECFRWYQNGVIADDAKEFCKESGIKLGIFSYWVSRSGESKGGFVPLMPEGNRQTKEVLEVTYPKRD